MHNEIFAYTITGRKTNIPSGGIDTSGNYKGKTFLRPCDKQFPGEKPSRNLATAKFPEKNLLATLRQPISRRKTFSRPCDNHFPGEKPSRNPATTGF